jgi:hypothetical protein
VARDRLAQSLVRQGAPYRRYGPQSRGYAADVERGHRRRGHDLPRIKFAADSPLEGDGFEPSVPPVTGKQFRRGPFAHPGTAVKIADSSVEASSQGYSGRTPF